MPLSKQHKQNSRERILESAVVLFCRNGFDNVSIDDLMQHAELTRGAFYSHFESKSDVYMHAITAAARNATLIKNMPRHLVGADWFDYFVNGYLSLGHVKQECSPCPMAFLATDVASSEPKVKQTYTEVFKSFTGLVKKHLPDEDSEAQRQALSMAISALIIGSVAISRALNDEKMQKQLLESSKQIALQLASSAEIT